MSTKNIGKHNLESLCTFYALYACEVGLSPILNTSILLEMYHSEPWLFRFVREYPHYISAPALLPWMDGYLEAGRNAYICTPGITKS